MFLNTAPPMQYLVAGRAALDGVALDPRLVVAQGEMIVIEGPWVLGAFAFVFGVALIGWQGLWATSIAEIAGPGQAGTALGFGQMFIQVGIIGGERRIDFPLSDARIQRACDRTVRERHGIILGGEQPFGLVGARQNGERSHGQRHGKPERHRNPSSCHSTPPCSNGSAGGSISGSASIRSGDGKL